MFDAAVAPGPRTSESVPGIVAGLLSADCAYLDEHAYKSIPAGAPTLATRFRDEGYRTAAVLSNPQLTPARGFDRGFETFLNLRTGTDSDDRSESNPGEDTTPLGPLTRFRNALRDPVRNRLRDRGLSAFSPWTLAFLLERLVKRRSDWPTVAGERVVTELINALDAGDRPVFAWAHLNDLHAPLHPDRIRAGGLLDDVSDLRLFRWDGRRVADTFEPGYAAMYDSALRYVDAQIGRVVEYLQATDQWDQTILVVTADHGEALHDRGVYGHASGSDRYAYDSTRDYMYEELLHVPLLVRTPDGGDRRVREPFSLVWLDELFADLMNFDRGPSPRSSGRTDHFGPTADTVVLADAISADGHTIVARSGRNKRISPCLGGNRGADADAFLFDLQTDPRERTDRAPDSELPVLSNATEALSTSPNDLQPVRESLDTDTRNQLEQLGYR